MGFFIFARFDNVSFNICIASKVSKNFRATYLHNKKQENEYVLMEDYSMLFILEICV